MKKFILLMMIATLRVLPSAESAPHFEFYFDDDKTTGLRMTTPVSDLRLTTRPQKQNFGAAVFTSNVLPRLPLTVKVGNLSAGGALSTLNSPELSAGSSPFTTSVTSASPLTAALPGHTSFSKPASAFLEFSTPPNQTVRRKQAAGTTPNAGTTLNAGTSLNATPTPNVQLPLSLKINTWLTDNASTPVTSFSADLPLPAQHLTLSASYLGGIFYYNSNSTSSCFLKSPYYPSAEHYCGLFQFSALIKNPDKSINLTLTTALYESPFGFYQLLYRSDSKLTTKHTSLFSQIFYNPYDQLLTSSGKTLSPSLQIKTGFLYKTPSKLASLYFKTPVFLRVGSNAYLKINLTQTEHPLKANTGLQFSTEKTTQSISLSAEGNLLSKSPLSQPHDFTLKILTTQLKSTWNLGNFTPALTLNLTLPQNQTSQKKYKLTASTGYQSKSKSTPFKITATTTLTGSPNSKAELKLSSSLSLHLKIKYLTIIGKLSFNEDIEI